MRYWDSGPSPAHLLPRMRIVRTCTEMHAHKNSMQSQCTRVQHVIRFGQCHPGPCRVHTNPTLDRPSPSWISQSPQLTKHGDSANQEREPVRTLDD